MSNHISSLQNKVVKELLLLRDKRSARRRANCFSVEGCLEIQRALDSGFEIKELYYSESLLSEQSKSILRSVEAMAAVRITSLDDHVFRKLVVRENFDGLLAVFTYRIFTLSDLYDGQDPATFLAYENLEKPGNLGAALRSADGAGVRGVILTGNSLDPFGPNVIRASLGAIFSVPIVECSNEQLVRFCAEHGLDIYAASPCRDAIYYEKNFDNSCCFVLGSESRGLSSFWSEESSIEKISIPMIGTMDSLNVSVASAVLAYEAQRQRSR